VTARPRRGLRALPAGGRIALAAVVALWAVAAISPAFSGRAREIHLEDRLLPPSGAHPFGTDDLGRDLLARVVAATPISLAIGLVAAAVSLGIGFTVGATAGFFGGAVDLVLSRVIEVVLCFPVLFLLLALAALLPPSPLTVVLAIGVTAWPGDARYVFVTKDGGHFEPRSVKVGARVKDRVEILSGVAEGETIVTTGNFLVDSESRLRAAIEGAETNAPERR